MAGNGSVYTSGNPSAPAGTQVGFIQMSGWISQTVTLAAGTYTVSFDAAQRENFQSNSQTIEVIFDNTILGLFTPSGTSYVAFTTSKFTATAVRQHPEIRGTESERGRQHGLHRRGHTYLREQRSRWRLREPERWCGADCVSNRPDGHALVVYWAGGGGRQRQRVYIGHPSAPEGSQVGVLQQTGQISQSIDLGAGTYTVSFAAAR